jgi:hypothetical protein
VGLRASLDRRGKSLPTGIRSPDSPARRQSLYRLRYVAVVGVTSLIIRDREKGRERPPIIELRGVP